jgi:signal transduction histidine kinase
MEQLAPPPAATTPEGLLHDADGHVVQFYEEDSFAVVAGQTERLTGVVSRLLDASQLGDSLTLVPRCFELVALVRDSVDSVGAVAAAGGTDVAIVGDGPVIGRWDRDRIAQVIQDLLANALKFGRGKPIEIRIARAPAWVEIAVRDDGPGIDPADQARIFDRFDRRASPERFAGLGLGLWIARRVIEAHGGTIAVDSRLGCGATFAVRLPFDVPPPP